MRCLQIGAVITVTGIDPDRRGNSSPGAHRFLPAPLGYVNPARGGGGVFFDDAPNYWLAREIVQRGTAVIYLVAFYAAIRQFRPLFGQNGLTPAPGYLAAISFWDAPGIFALHYSDRFFTAVAGTGAVLSAAMAAGLGNTIPLWAAMLCWSVLWLMYLSIVNIGQRWYAFGWESLLLEAGFLMVFLGNDDIAPPLLILMLLRWLVFRVEFGAGLVKIRGDRCWRDLSALDYHHETQPMPGPLSWFFHHLPRPVHRVEVLGNHLTQLVVPFGLFAPAPVADVAALVIIGTQLWLVLSGNFAWLNWLTMVLASSALADSTVGVSHPDQGYDATPGWFVMIGIAVTAVIVVLSVWPVRNMLSASQKMNATFNPLHLVNTYGAFGSITRHRDELVIEGADELLDDDTVWREYGFRGKPGALDAIPRQYAPYHLRLDWMMWFAAISPRYASGWLGPLLNRLLVNDPATMRLLRHNPFPDRPPAVLRVQLYRYEFSTWSQLRGDGLWWQRKLLGTYLEPITLRMSDSG